MIEINNRKLDNAKDLDVILPMYNSIVYSNDYTEILGTLWIYCRYEPDDSSRF